MVVMSKRNVPAPLRIEAVKATRAETDEQILKSWLKSLNSPHTRINFDITARRFLDALPMGLRSATIEDVRDALAKTMVDANGDAVGDATTRQYVLRIKSLLGYAHRSAIRNSMPGQRSRSGRSPHIVAPHSPNGLSARSRSAD
jgi:hypothetical protein